MMLKRNIAGRFVSLVLVILLGASLGCAMASGETAQGTEHAAHSLAIRPQARADLESLAGLTHYDIYLDVNYDDSGLQGRVQVDYTNTEDVALDRLYFRLFPNGGRSYGDGALNVSRVTVDDIDVQTALSLEDTVLEVQLPELVAVGERIEIELEFGGTVPNGDTGYGIYSLKDGVMTLSGWYPILAVYDDKGWNLDPVSDTGDSVYSDMALYTVNVVVERDLKVVATGIRLCTHPVGNVEVRSRFASGPVRDFVLVFSPDFGQASRTADGTTINAYYLPGHEEQAEATLDVAVDSLRAFNEKFGAYPYTELDVVDVPMNGPGGVEYPGIVLVASDIFGMAIVTAHEIAHQWWYGVVGNDVIDEPWLDEALASYSEVVYLEYAEGQAASEQHIQGFRRQFEYLTEAGADDLVTAGLSHFENKGSLYSSIVYGKGALFFDAIRATIGDEAFFGALRTHYENLKYGIATAEDLLEVFEVAADLELDDLYEQWLYSKAIAKYEDIDDGLFAQLSTTFELFRTAADRIWTADYRFDQEPMLYVRTDADGEALYGYLINHPEPESFDGAELVALDEELALPSVYRLDREALPHPEALANIPYYSFDFPANGTDVFLMKYNDPGTDAHSAPTTFDWAKYVAHEAFHRYQMSCWEHPSESSQDVESYPLDADSIPMIFLETHVLLDGLSAADDEARDTALRRFVAVRSARMEQWDLVRLMDGFQEHGEGTARYLEYRLDDVAGEENNGLSMEQYLEMILSPQSGMVRAELAFGRFYSTGAALCALMDDIGLDWRPLIEAGQTPYDILAAHYGVEDQEALLQQAQAAHDYDALLEIATQVAEKAASEPSDIFGGAMPSGSEGDEIGGMIQKPYKATPERLTPSYIPIGYKMLGSFQYVASEIEFAPMRSMYSPQGFDVTVIDLSGPNGVIRINRSEFVDGTLEAWRASSLGMPLGIEEIAVGDTPVLPMDLSGDPSMSYTMTVCVYNDELILVEGPISLDENLKIITGIIGE